MELDVPDLVPDRGERVAIIGPSGCGKTCLIMEMVPYFPNLVILDPKRELPSKGFNVITRPEELYWQMLFKKFPIMYRPTAKDHDNPKVYDKLFRQIFERGNITLVIDDVTVFADAVNFPHGLRLCCNQGRSKKVTVITLMQGPSNVPRCTYTQGTVFFVFYLNDADDRRRVQKYVRGYDATTLAKHEFFYYRLTFGHDAIKCLMPEPDASLLSA